MAKRVALPVLKDLPYRPNGKMPLRYVRRAAQAGFLLLWLALFFLTRDQVVEAIPPDLFLITDPLVAALTMGAAQVVVPTMIGALFFVVFTLVFGRAFCGWICPLGTLIDYAAWILKPPEKRFTEETHQRMQLWKYWVLAVMAFAALFSAQWAYLLDPLVLMFRGLTVGVYPMANAILPAGWFPGKLRMEYTGVALLPVVLLVASIAVTWITPRFFCRYLCPLGAFYGLLSRVPLLKRRVTGCDACTGIRSADLQCITGCRMGAVPANPIKTQNHECIRCFSGRSFCHTEAIHFDWKAPAVERQDSALAMDRRKFLVLGASGVAMAPLASLSAYHRGEANDVIRPPRVLDEGVFTDECIRCAMCVQACPTQTLQLTHLEAGFAGFWTPAVTASVGGCIAECNACSVACPTDAIPVFGKAESDKWSVKMGTVVLEKGRCISYANLEKCEECLKVCPTKAFVIEEPHGDVPRRPASVDYFRCVGCGLCETACRNIVFGRPALVTHAHGRGQPSSIRENPTATYEIPLVLKPAADR
jgi:polyferredoxin